MHTQDEKFFRVGRFLCVRSRNRVTKLLFVLDKKAEAQKISSGSNNNKNNTRKVWASFESREKLFFSSLYFYI